MKSINVKSFLDIVLLASKKRDKNEIVDLINKTFTTCYMMEKDKFHKAVGEMKTQKKAYSIKSIKQGKIDDNYRNHGSINIGSGYLEGETVKLTLEDKTIHIIYCETNNNLRIKIALRPKKRKRIKNQEPRKKQKLV